MSSCKNLILEYSTTTVSFGIEELWKWISAIANFSRNTVECLLYRLVAAGDIIRISKGLYARSFDRKVFTAFPTERELAIAKKLKEKFPFAPFCVYNGSVLSTLQHHLSANNITYVETDRDAIESVFNSLRENDDRVWLMPDAEFVYRYIDLAKGGIIIKPLVTEAPLKVVSGISTPTLEKLLVDIVKDDDFSYLQGVEAERMLHNAKSLYAVNESRLRRYSRRRGIPKTSTI